jgi:predicted O-methyltransferase YrrM
MVTVLAAVVTGVAGAAGHASVAWAFLGTSLIALSGSIFLTSQMVMRRIAGLERAFRRASTPPKAERANARRAAGRDRVSFARHTKSVRSSLVAMRQQIDHVPYLSAELSRRYSQLIPDDRPMPVVGANWAARAPVILFIVDEILGDSGRRSILECGSGASTVWTAAALRHRGAGHVVALEADASFGAETRARLVEHGLEPWATVVDAPLVDTVTESLGHQPWYDLSDLGDLDKVDLLFVDGPPRSTAKLARFPAVPQLLPRLRVGALVVLDDTHRGDEKEIVRLWSDLEPSPTSLSVVKEVGRSTVLRVTAEDS